MDVAGQVVRLMILSIYCSTSMSTSTCTLTSIFRSMYSNSVTGTSINSYSTVQMEPYRFNGLIISTGYRATVCTVPDFRQKYYHSVSSWQRRDDVLVLVLVRVQEKSLYKSLFRNNVDSTTTNSWRMCSNLMTGQYKHWSPTPLTRVSALLVQLYIEVTKDMGTRVNGATWGTKEVKRSQK